MTNTPETAKKKLDEPRSMNPHAVLQLLIDLRPHLERLIEIESQEELQEEQETMLDELDETIIQVKRALR